MYGTLFASCTALATISLDRCLQVFNYVFRSLESLVGVDHANDLPERFICISLVVDVKTLRKVVRDEEFSPDLLAAENLHLTNWILFEEWLVEVFDTSDEAH
jgi:hypothetical protein